jgi:hypothetical protein
MMSNDIIILMLNDIKAGGSGSPVEATAIKHRRADSEAEPLTPGGRTPMSEGATGRTPAYSITEVVEVLDPAGAQRYAELTPIAVEKFGGRVVLGASPTVPPGIAPAA